MRCQGNNIYSCLDIAGKRYDYEKICSPPWAQALGLLTGAGGVRV